MRKKKNKLPEAAQCLSKRYSQFCGKYQKAPVQIKFLMDFFGFFDCGKSKNEDIKVIAFCSNQEIQRILLELGDKGADVVTIHKCIEIPHFHKYELARISQTLKRDAALHQQFNDAVDKTAKGLKEFNKMKKALRGAEKVICNLKPIDINSVYQLRKDYPDFNERLAALQKEIETVVNLYIDYTPTFSNKSGNVTGEIGSNWAIPLSRIVLPDKLTSKSRLWNKRIITIVDELRRVGFSDRKAYRTTINLFKSTFPDIWKDADPDLIRQRYTYNKKKVKK